MSPVPTIPAPRRRQRGCREVVLVAYPSACPTSAWVASEWVAALGALGVVALGRDVSGAAAVREAFQGMDLHPPAQPRLDYGILTGMHQLLLHLPPKFVVGVGTPPNHWKALGPAWGWPTCSWSSWPWTPMPSRELPSDVWAPDAWELGGFSGAGSTSPSEGRPSLPWAAPARCLDAVRAASPQGVWSLDPPRCNVLMANELRQYIARCAGWEEVWEKLAPPALAAHAADPVTWPREGSEPWRSAWALLQDWTLARKADGGHLTLLSPHRTVVAAWHSLGVPALFMPSAKVRDGLSQVEGLVALGDPWRGWVPGPWEWAAAATGCACVWGGGTCGVWDQAASVWAPDGWTQPDPSWNMPPSVGRQAREVIAGGQTWEHRARTWRRLLA